MSVAFKDVIEGVIELSSIEVIEIQPYQQMWMTLTVVVCDTSN